MPEIDAVVIITGWNAHVDVAIDAMRAGKYVGLEVGGAYSIEECWKLIRAYEETGTPLMMLENCCYGQLELMFLNMVKKGVLGEIVHCEGGYHHYLPEETTAGETKRHYRAINYQLRNCHNYPSHDLLPISKILNINDGNRILSLASFPSKSVGINECVKREFGEDHPLVHARFAQADIVTTVIKCARGETITLTLDTTLPRGYSRGLCVHGTLGYAEEASKSIFLEKDMNKYKNPHRADMNNIPKYAKKYEHPLWKDYEVDKVKAAGHGGMDWHVLRAFFESAMAGVEPPIDIYDAVTIMAITPLSEDSIATGSSFVAVPDFTAGKWMNRGKRKFIESYRLDATPKIRKPKADPKKAAKTKTKSKAK